MVLFGDVAYVASWIDCLFESSEWGQTDSKPDDNYAQMQVSQTTDRRDVTIHDKEFKSLEAAEERIEEIININPERKEKATEVAANRLFSALAKLPE